MAIVGEGSLEMNSWETHLSLKRGRKNWNSLCVYAFQTTFHNNIPSGRLGTANKCIKKPRCTCYFFVVLLINLKLFDVVAAKASLVCSRRSDSGARCFPLVPSFFSSSIFLPRTTVWTPGTGKSFLDLTMCVNGWESKYVFSRLPWM